jgi:hypothetical protein
MITVVIAGSLSLLDCALYDATGIVCIGACLGHMRLQPSTSATSSAAKWATSASSPPPAVSSATLVAGETIAVTLPFQALLLRPALPERLLVIARDELKIESGFGLSFTELHLMLIPAFGKQCLCSLCCVAPYQREAIVLHGQNSMQALLPLHVDALCNPG